MSKQISKRTQRKGIAMNNALITLDEGGWGMHEIVEYLANDFNIPLENGIYDFSEWNKEPKADDEEEEV